MALSKTGRRLAEFRAHGPFLLATARNAHGREVDRRVRQEFWNEQPRRLLAERCGCYVFAIRTSKRYIPYYVGQTGVGFTRECFTRRNLALFDRFDRALAQHGKSASVLFLLCGESRKVKSRIIDEIETFFIQLAGDRNPKLLTSRVGPSRSGESPASSGAPAGSRRRRPGISGERSVCDHVIATHAEQASRAGGGSHSLARRRSLAALGF